VSVLVYYLSGVYWNIINSPN